MPRLPVNLLKHTPRPRKAAFFFSNTLAKAGSKPALTSLESIRLAQSARRSARSPGSPESAQTSATMFSKKREFMPVAPTLPISSLSVSTQQSVYSGVPSVSSSAASDG